jgi:glycosyltransferase involved in cell wall biosynthesis
MANSPLVSVLLPVSNAEGIIGDAIVSVLRQTFADFELIVVDNASEDMSARVVRGFASHDKRIRFHRNSIHCGLYENYNQCLRISVGKYIKPLSQKALLHPTALAQLVEVLNRKPAVALVGFKTDQTNAPFESDVRIGFVETATKVLNQSRNLIGEPTCVLFRREYISSGFDKRLSYLSDIDYWLRILHNGDFFYINEVLCNMQKDVAPLNFITRDRLQILLEWLLVASKNKTLFQKTHENPNEFCLQLVREFMSMTNLENNVEDVFDSFETDSSKPRELAKEVQAFARLCMMDSRLAQTTAPLIAGEQPLLATSTSGRMVQD